MSDVETLSGPVTRRLLVGASAPVAALLFTAYSLHRSDVGFHIQAQYGVYALLGLALPGFVLWRVLVAPSRSTLLADVVGGVSLAYAAELAVYLCCAHLDHPGVAWAWPAIPLLASAHPRLRRRVWRRSERTEPTWMYWLLSALVSYSVALVASSYWDAYPLRGPLTRSPSVDMTYHLSLIGALSRHIPTDIPSVAGQHLYYHWFFHADTAAARLATGIDPVILLTRLGPLLLTFVIIVGVAVVVGRLTRSSLAGGVAAVVVCGASSAPYGFGPQAGLLTGYLFPSPTTTFAMAVLVAPTLMLVDGLTRTEPLPRTWWLAIALSLAALSGAKGSMLPVVLAGLVAVVLMELIVHRRIHRRALGLLAIVVVWFELAQRLVYGGSAQGTSLKLFGFGDLAAHDLRLNAPGVSTPIGLGIAVTIVYLLALIPLWAGIAGLFTREVWRDPRAHFLVGCSVAAAGAVVALDNSGFNEVYFLRIAPPLIVTGGVWGLAVLASRLPAASARRLAVAGAATGLGTGFLALLVFGTTLSTNAARLLLPPVLVIVACLVIGSLLGWTLAPVGTVGGRRLAILLATGSALAVLGVPGAVVAAVDIATDPQTLSDKAAPEPPRRFTIGPGGIQAARWLRDHSSTDALVATNVHCMYPHTSICDHRATWVSAYTERQSLLEGWAYTSRTAADAQKQGVAAAYATFWAPDVLHANDFAITHPSSESIERLRQLGVDWIFVDRRFPSNVRGLARVAQERFHVDQYAIFQIG